MEYRADVDGLRAIAALAVLGGHTGITPGVAAPVGVDIFFVISGFLISGIVLRSVAQGNFSFIDFYARRAKRIFPALIVVLLSVLVTGWLLLLPDEFQRLGLDIASGAAFGENLYQYQWVHEFFIPRTNFDRGFIPHLWSLGVEEQFYLLWPLLLVLAAKSGDRSLLAMSAVFIISIVLYESTANHDFYAAYFLPWNRLWQLALGGHLAYAQLALSNSSNSMRSALTMGAQRVAQQTLGIVGALLLVDSIVHWALPASQSRVAATAGTVLLISSGPDGYVNRHLLSRRPLVLVGLISYPLYLWHVPVLSLGPIFNIAWTGNTPVQASFIGAIFVLAFLTYRYVESPLRSRQNPRRTAFHLSIVMAGIAASGLLAATLVIPPRSDSPVIHEFVSAASEEWHPTSDGSPESQNGAGIITLGRDSRHVLFIGDNTMQQYFRHIRNRLAERRTSEPAVLFATKQWCAPGGIEIIGDSFTRNFRSQCKAHIARALSCARDPRVTDVVIGAGWYFYFMQPPPVGRFGSPASLKEGSEDAFRSLETLISDLILIGKRVHLVLDGPIGASYDPRYMVLRRIKPPGLSISIPPAPTTAEMRQTLEPVSSHLIELAKRAGASIIDPMQSLCDEHICPVVTPEGKPIYRDMWNIRPSYAEKNTSIFDEVLAFDSPRTGSSP